MVSDQDIARCVESLLRHAAPSSSAAASESSLSGVVRQAEAKLGVDLSHKAAFIRDQIDLLTQPQPSPPPQTMMAPPVTAAVPYLNHPYILSQHQLLQPTPQALAPSSIAATTSTVADAAPSAYMQQLHPELSYGYPPPPPLPAAAVVAAYHLQQQLHQPQNVLPAATTVWPVSGASTKESAPTGTKRRGGPGGLNKVCGVSPELQVIVGEATMPRTQIVKQLWQYIRKNNLQDPNNKRNIICNDELRRVFETDCTDMFKMNKLLSKHIITLDPTKDPVQQESKKLKLTDVVSVPELDVSGNPLIISDALTKFFGSDQREMLQSEALSRLWEYIKTNQLEDSGNGSILCDSKLQELFGCESLPTSGVSEMLAHHLFKIS